MVDWLFFTQMLVNIVPEYKSVFQNWVIFFFLIVATLDVINERKGFLFVFSFTCVLDSQREC